MSIHAFLELHFAELAAKEAEIMRLFAEVRKRDERIAELEQQLAGTAYYTHLERMEDLCDNA
jgi:uncharacterized protein YdcH (DUF465 family)